jgi:hypothetical protein
MATKKIIPTNPDTKVTDEVEDDKDTAERKTAYIKVGRKTARKTSNLRIG